ncbi:CASP8-associated protein 2 [Silurus asotus]|uniref:CASP8-associated protein 2 n=1 Tax=Silurus asotus TaxID=30991 RepID=A0AAD5FGP8_SILAS|nr:CASP8-associated protein 2 [Silurus asotus]
MQTSAIDELYGDLDQGVHDSVLDYNEDSVDIYSGLEDSPKRHINHGNTTTTTFLSPHRVKESLDLYEELLTEEQEEKDSTYNEMKSKFVAAQNQVQDLLAKLQQVQTKNLSLHQENTLLKKNICALIKTAKMEIVRKDEEISKLSRRTIRGNFHPSAKERGQAAYSRCAPASGGESQESPGFTKGSLVSVDATPSSFSVFRRCQVENSLNLQNNHSQSSDSLPNAGTQDQRRAPGNQTCCTRDRESPSTNSESSTGQNVCKETDMRKEAQGKESASRRMEVLDKHQSRPEREQREPSKSSCGSGSSQRQQQDDPVTLRMSGRSKSPSSRAITDTQGRKEESRHKQGLEKARRSVEGRRSEKGSSHRKTEKRGTREHHRKEERRQEGISSSESRRSGIKERRRSPQSEERKRPDGKSSNGEERRSLRAEGSKEHDRQGAKDAISARDSGRSGDGPKDRSRSDVRESRRHSLPVKPHHLRKDQDDKRSGRTEEPMSRSKSSSSRDDSQGDTYTSSVKERSDKNKRTGTSSMSVPDKARVHKRSQGDKVQAEGPAKRISPIRLTSSCGDENAALPEESSPKRKLSFMETLNLTVSPVKKQNNSERAEETPHPEETLISNLTKDGNPFEVGEEFCVIDEVADDSVEGSFALPTNTIAQPYDDEPPTCLEVKGQELDLPKMFDGDYSKTQAGKMDVSDSEMQEDICTTSISQEGVVDKIAVPEDSSLLEKSTSVDSLSSLSLTDVSCKEQDPQASVENFSAAGQIDDKPEKPLFPNDQFQQHVATSVMLTPAIRTCSEMDTSVSLEVVSSIVAIDNQQSKETLPDLDMEITPGLKNLTPSPGSLILPSIEENNLKAQEAGIPTRPASSSEPDSIENEIELFKTCKHLVVPHDEDSMMLTLSNLKVIPEAISPLTSPVRQIKKSQQQRLGKEPHVKSLGKDFSTSATVVDKEAVKMDMNKENKRPDSLVKLSVKTDQQDDLLTTATEEDLEEGEIISESDGEGTLVIQSPQNEKRSSLRSQTSPRSQRLQNKSQTRAAVTPTRKEKEKNVPPKDSPSSNKRRFKTVTVPPKARISTATEFMNMLSFIRSELRRKYMKLHKNVAKPAFCCIIEMSQASFTEFVDSVNFHKFCSQGNEIKPRLNKIITSVTSKVSSNGIVNRIFEQRAEDLKQKLWNFVDGQFDFLFKELKAALKGAADLFKNKSSSESKQPSAKEDLTVDLCKIQCKEPLSTTENRPQKMSTGEIESECQNVQEKISSSNSLPSRSRGLGSSGKNIKATMEEGAKVPEVPNPNFNQSNPLQSGSFSEKSHNESVPVHENKTTIPAPSYTRRLSHSGSIQDRADFEILTEQQTSSLTFNLVTDSQMGDIFRCLLQGSDLMEAGDHQNWPLNTPRKEGQAGESLVGLMTPSKMITPSKLITAWTSISPYKFQMPLNPALLDENCMLEVPTNALSNHSALPASTATSQHSFSILAEDLAVSLTIPSPLKSDGHLSFLQPMSGQVLTTPSNIISAHYSEDALLDGEDATEQDIHLSLETDNSSSPSGGSGNWEATTPPAFHFKPNVPMQAEVMEKSNDHFIVRIRHTSPRVQEHTEMEPTEIEHTETLPGAGAPSLLTFTQSVPLAVQAHTMANEVSEAEISREITSHVVPRECSPISVPKTTDNPIEQSANDADASGFTATTELEPEVKKASNRGSKKRKKHHSGPKAKRSRKEKSQDRQDKQRHKKRSKSSKEKIETTPLKRIKMPSPQLSPNSLSAKNVIRKKGEVVATWSREEDRDILVALKTKGASSKTFAALSSKLGKSQAQIEERFTQLMKLFKKKEKMES